ncbi:N-alpha-acetyltransferase 50-like isoform X2 [Dysidea avara]|uniref:N-alpha-acetyltransferase 50-like isoform X2 n=1 Tax=Dysidea avara TaxID=196820 RepID=UPI00332C4393
MPRPQFRVELGDITPHNIKQLRKLNAAVFPIAYTDKFYKDVLELGELAKFAYFNDIVVGGVCCRVETEAMVKKLYIMTLGCLAAYRRLGVGTLLLKHVLTMAEQMKDVDIIYLHVQTNNEAALEFYKKFDFFVTETKEGYYKTVEPADAYVLQKTLKEPNYILD